MKTDSFRHTVRCKTATKVAFQSQVKLKEVSFVAQLYSASHNCSDCALLDSKAQTKLALKLSRTVVFISLLYGLFPLNFEKLKSRNVIRVQLQCNSNVHCMSRLCPHWITPMGWGTAFKARPLPPEARGKAHHLVPWLKERVGFPRTITLCPSNSHVF